jgi:D-alanyl-lipoteichoic acid acyltransferase DltB (MBOAT superfamily)
MFYPQLVAGPIERPQNLLHQFYEPHQFDAERATRGLRLMLWGLFKKVVIADRLAVIVDAVYDAPRHWSGATLVLATVLFAFQIYCDFSGYSDIALGAAQVMGFKLMANFNRPYYARSVSEFWKRWHISLSTWFKDYLYVPLGGNRGSPRRWYANLLFTFIVSGLWHGASWTFVAWGALNGLYLLGSIWTRDWRARLVTWSGLSRHPRWHAAVATLTTFALTCYAWILFRANSLDDAVYINRAIAALCLHPLSQSWHGLSPASRLDLGVAVLLIGLLELVHRLQETQDLTAAFEAQPLWARWAAYYALVLSLLGLGEFGARQFIYFQF